MVRSEQNCWRLSRNQVGRGSRTNVVFKLAAARVPPLQTIIVSGENIALHTLMSGINGRCAIAPQSGVSPRNWFVRQAFPDDGPRGGTVDSLGAKKIMS